MTARSTGPNYQMGPKKSRAIIGRPSFGIDGEFAEYSCRSLGTEKGRLPFPFFR